MGLRSSVQVEYALPDGEPGGWFSTSDLPDPFGDYVLTPDGKLLQLTCVPALHEHGSPEDEPVHMSQGMPSEGMMAQGRHLLAHRWHASGHEQVDYSGFVGLQEGNRLYTFKLEHGVILGARLGGLQAWATPGGDLRTALLDLALACNGGRTSNPSEIAAYISVTLEM